MSNLPLRQSCVFCPPCRSRPCCSRPCYRQIQVGKYGIDDAYDAVYHTDTCGQLCSYVGIYRCPLPSSSSSTVVIAVSLVAAVVVDVVSERMACRRGILASCLWARAAQNVYKSQQASSRCLWPANIQLNHTPHPFPLTSHLPYLPRLHFTPPHFHLSSFTLL